MSDWWQDDGPDWKQMRKDHGLPPGSESAIIDIWFEAAAAERERLRARVIENPEAGILTTTEDWPLGLWLSPEDFLTDPGGTDR